MLIEIRVSAKVYTPPEKGKRGDSLIPLVVAEIQEFKRRLKLLGVVADFGHSMDVDRAGKRPKAED